MSNFQTIDDEEIEQSVLVTDVTALKSQIALTSSSNMKTAVDLNTAKTGITNQQALDIASNNLKTGITNTQAALILSNEDDIETNENDITGIKGKTDYITITQSVDLDLVENDVTGIKNNTLSSTLKSAVDANIAKTGITSGQASAIVANTAKVTYNSTDSTKMALITIASSGVNLNTMESNISTNNAKVTYPSQDSTRVDKITVTANINLDTIASNVSTNNAKTGITSGQASAITANTAKTSFPTDLNNLLAVSDTYELEVGNNAGIPRIRLRGQNGQAISSELIFIDAIGNNPEYYQGASIRFNSSANKLSFYTDQNNDNSPAEAMYITRATAPTTTINILYVANGFYLGSQDHSVQTRFLYAHRVIVNSDGDDAVPLTNSSQVLTWKNTIANGLANDESTGNITVSVTGLYNIMACVMCKTTSAQRSVALTLKNASDTNVFSMNQHLSKHESSSSTYSMVRMNGLVRLDSSVTYHFGIHCDNDGAGTIVNTDHLNNCCIIKQLPLPNGYTLASDWGTA